MLRKSVVMFTAFMMLVSVTGCTKAGAKSSEPSLKAETVTVKTKNPDFEKIDQVFSLMSPRFQQEVKIPEEKKEEFLADLKKMISEQDLIKAQYGSEDLSLLYLIDKKNFVSETYVPKNLKHLETNQYYAVNKNNLNLRPEAYDALAEMTKAATAENVRLTISSTYRSYEYQKNLFDYWVRVDGLEEAERESARPGTSQHQLGCALDFAPVDDNFDLTDGGAWVYKNAWKYGWSLSFPKQYEDITGYKWECWHFRYVGKTACQFQKKWFCDVQQYMIEFVNEWLK